MSDDLFDYFNKNSTRKFEPIDDPDFNSFEESAEPTKSFDDTDRLDSDTQPPSSLSTPADQGLDSTRQTAANFPASTSTSEPTSESGVMVDSSQSHPSNVPQVSAAFETPIKAQSVPAQELKSENHWDFLASLLGIKTRTEPKPARPKLDDPQTPEGTPTTPNPATPATATQAPATPAPGPRTTSTKVDAGFGAGILSAPTSASEVNNPLDEMFRPGDLPAELDIFDRLESEKEDSVFVSEFGEEDDEAENVQVIDNDLEFLEFEIEELDSYRNREDSERELGRKRRPQRSFEVEENTSLESRSNRKERRHTRQGEKTEIKGTGSIHSSSEGGTAPESRKSRGTEDDSGFGKGLFDDELGDDTDINPKNFEERAKSNRRRRSRRGEKAEASLAENDESKKTRSKIENDPPDEFFDEIGWDPDTVGSSAKNKQSIQRDSFQGDESFEDDEDLLEPNESEEPTRKRRRRRRSRGGSQQNEPGSAARVINKTLEDQSHSEDDDEVTPKAKFPTWEEAIAGLVQSNIKNHSRYDRGGRSSGGGRRRR